MTLLACQLLTATGTPARHTRTMFDVHKSRCIAWLIRCVPPFAQFMTGQAMLFTLGRSDGVSQGWFAMWMRCALLRSCSSLTYLAASLHMLKRHHSDRAHGHL